LRLRTAWFIRALGLLGFDPPTDANMGRPPLNTKIMKLEDILKSLCYYDKRNPDGADDEAIEDRKLFGPLRYGKQCNCDNCFYGRTQLAEHILSLSIYWSCGK
jgi:hypothetical protein